MFGLNGTPLSQAFFGILALLWDTLILHVKQQWFRLKIQAMALMTLSW